MSSGESPRCFFIAMIRLSSRLQALAELVPPGAAVIDVGTDHAMLPVWLVQSGRSRRVLATDIRSGPLKNAASLIEKTGTAEHITLFQTDGLRGVDPAGWDAVILAGMGGETMISILSAAPWTKEGPLLVLSPHSRRAKLRSFLVESGYCITSERLTEDAGRIYPILTAKGGESRRYSPAELHLGRLDQIGGDPLLKRYLAQRIAQAEKAAPFEPEAHTLAAELKTIERSLFHDNGR